MSQLEQRQLLRRQEETIRNQSTIIIRNAREIEKLEDKLDKTVKMARRTVHEVSFVSDLCMFASGASSMYVIRGILNGEISKTVFFTISSILTLLVSIGIRKSDWM